MMQFNIYVTVKNHGQFSQQGLERFVRQVTATAANLVDILPDVDETIELHDDSEVTIHLNRSE